MNSLTKSQYLLWAGQMLSPEVPLYNMPFRFDIKGVVDPILFERAFQKLVSECDVMRTIFILDEDNLPVQKVTDDRLAQCDILDFSDKVDGLDILQKWIEEKNVRNFTLEEISYESALIKISEHHWVWYLNQHHIITDAWGISVQFQRISEIYEGLISGVDTTTALPEFSDYISYENQVEHNSKKREFWKNEIQGAPPLPSLYNYTGSRLHSESTRYFSLLSQEQQGRLLNIINEPDLKSFTEHISKFSIFMTVLMAYLYKVSGQRNLVVGTPSHNRGSQKFKLTPGVFIEFFPIAVEIENGDSLGSLYQRVRNQVLAFLMNSGSSMASPEMSTTFNVVLNYIHASFGDFAGMSTKSEWLHIGHCDPRHDLRVHVMEDEEGMPHVMMDMNDQVFSGVQSKAKVHFEAILQAFLDDRSIALDEIGIVEEDRRMESTGQKNAGTLTLNSNLRILQNSDIKSFQEIEYRVGQYKNYFEETGVVIGERIGLYLSRSFDLVCAIIAVLESNLTYIPLPKDYPLARVRKIAKDAGLKVVFSEDDVDDDSDSFINVNGVQGASLPISKNLIDTSSEVSAYTMYTSGSTGEPKGVEISRSALGHYLRFAIDSYTKGGQVNAPLFTSIGFDLTVTSLFLPLLAGGSLQVYREPNEGPDLSVLEVAKNDHIDFIKWTPSHMEMVKDTIGMSGLRTMVVGGEDFKTDLARFYDDAYKGEVEIMNEYGPTEATVGTVVHRFNKKTDSFSSVPIGSPIEGVQVLIVNKAFKKQPERVSGELLLAGASLANGYWGDQEKTNHSFISLPEYGDILFYRTGDLVYADENKVLHYQGRIDQQLKVGGRRIEPQEIAQVAEALPEVSRAVVAMVGAKNQNDEVINCKSCGLPSNFPGVSFNEEEECSLCENFTSYSERVKGYFKDRAALQEIFDNTPREDGSQYDCIMLLSGGKDSTYALAQLADMGLKVLAFTLDNGYISQGALDNAKRVCLTLGIDHVFGKTEAMNEIFVDSLKRYNNVCNGCFKVIYTLSTQIALEKKIPIIVTGLSRGQFFETRLTEELFWDQDAGPDKIDEVILNARKEYHRTDDAVSRLMDTDFFEDDDVFEKVKFVDFYRYNDVELGDLMTYLKEKLPWVRPLDTGRSTNCLINQLGIHVHKANVGYSNYAFPYSWDVRIGHKNRDESLDEINEEIDVPAVERIMEEIGYNEKLGSGEEHLTIFYTTDQNVSSQKIKAHLSSELPDYMVPWSYVLVDEIPMTKNGKVDHGALIDQYRPSNIELKNYVAPSTDFEIMVSEVWKEVLLLDKIGVEDGFLEIGGNSLIAIRVVSRINKKFRLELGLNVMFKYPTIRKLAEHIEDVIRRLLENG